MSEILRDGSDTPKENLNHRLFKAESAMRGYEFGQVPQEWGALRGVA